jgi:hypothetical protein
VGNTLLFKINASIVTTDFDKHLYDEISNYLQYIVKLPDFFKMSFEFQKSRTVSCRNRFFFLTKKQFKQM